MRSLPYWIACAVYAMAMVLVGWFIRRRRQTRRLEGLDANLEFWIARRQIGSWNFATSLTAGWLMLGWIGFGMSQIYMYGAAGLWILPIPWFLLCFLIIALVPRVRRMGAVSLPQAIEQRFGPNARLLLALLSFGVFLAWTQAELFMAGNLMSPFLGVSPRLCMALLVLPILLYTWLGGFRAIVLTDMLQFLIMAVFMIVLATVAIGAAHTASGGDILGALRNAAPPLSGKGQAMNLWFLGSLFPLVLLVGYLPGWLLEQDLVLRIQAVRTTREAVRGAVLGLLLITAFVIVLPAVAAFCALVAFPPVAGAPAPEVGANAYGILTAFIAPLPLALSVFMLLGIVACQMSTIDTFTNVAALALAYDVLEPSVLKRRTADPRALGTARAASVAVSLLGLLCAFVSDSLQDVYYISSGVLSAGVALPALCIFWKRATGPAVLAASALGSLATVAGYFYEMKHLQAADPQTAHHYTQALPGFLQNSYGYNYIAAGVLLAALVLVSVSLLTPRASAAQLASVRPAPVDDYPAFLRDVS